MHCLKCGQEIKAPEVFCKECLRGMEKHPVSRETPVAILPRPAYDPERRSRRQQKPEELLAKSRKRQRRWMQACIGLVILCLILGAALVIRIINAPGKPSIGQNYITNVTATADSTP